MKKLSIVCFMIEISIYTALTDKLRARIYITHKHKNIALPENCGGKQWLPPLRISRWCPTHSRFYLSTFTPIASPYDTLFDTNIRPFLPKLYDIGSSVTKVDLDKLPQSFVLKTNHNCGGVVLVPDKKAFLSDSKTFHKSMQNEYESKLLSLALYNILRY